MAMVAEEEEVLIEVVAVADEEVDTMEVVAGVDEEEDTMGVAAEDAVLTVVFAVAVGAAAGVVLMHRESSGKSTPIH